MHCKADQAMGGMVEATHLLVSVLPLLFISDTSRFILHLCVRCESLKGTSDMLGPLRDDWVSV